MLDPEKLQKYENLSVEDIRKALQQENQELPGGRVDKGLSEVGLRTMGRLDRTEDYRKLIVANRGDLNRQAVRVDDVGTVSDSFEEPLQPEPDVDQGRDALKDASATVP